MGNPGLQVTERVREGAARFRGQQNVADGPPILGDGYVPGQGRVDFTVS
jgi:hypothetical protein